MPASRPSSALPTRQPRSLQTQERILAAAESLLSEGDDESITMERIAERAHVSVGAIYKRFQGKSSLLPLVLARVQEQRLGQLQEFLAQPHWRDAGLGERIQGVLSAFATSQVQQRRLTRALVVGYWQSDDRANEADAARLMTAIHDWLSECAAEIEHPEPRLALSLGMYMALQTLQSAILLDRIPPQVGVERFTAEVARMFRHYLAAEPVPRTG